VTVATWFVSDSENNFAASVPRCSLFLRFGSVGQQQRLGHYDFDFLLLNQLPDSGEFA
jgi:hypothetical protein